MKEIEDKNIRVEISMNLETAKLVHAHLKETAYLSAFSEDARKVNKFRDELETTIKKYQL